jgi:hypothetical protein
MMEWLILVISALPDLLAEHGSSLGLGGGSAVAGGLGTYVVMSSRLERLETLLTERLDTLGRDLKRLALASNERDAYQEGKLDAAVREERSHRALIFKRIDRMNTRLSFLEGRAHRGGLPP